MKTTLSTFLAFVLLLSSCTSHPDKKFKKFTLQGKINGQDSGIVVLTYWSDTDRINDTVKIKKGKFIFTGKIFEPTEADLTDGKDLELAMVFLEPRRMKITIFKNKPLETKMSGSKTQTEFTLLNKIEEPIYERFLLLKEQRHNFNDSIKNSKAGPVKLLLEKKAEETDSLLSQTLKELDPIELKFVLENPKSYVTPLYLRMLEAREVISLDSAKTIFNGLDNSIKKSRYGKIFIKNIRKKENIRIGNQAPDFKATDLNQQTLTLSQFKGKSVVLLDFWASWCVPCRQSIPHVKMIFEKYHSKGLEVIAVSVDEDRKAWIEAVKQDNTDMWYHILIADKWPNGPITADDIYQNYYYKGIPEQFLIDKNGKIIDRIGGYSKENEVSLDRQLSQLLDN